MRSALLLLSLGLQAIVVAQTVIVDANNGPGTHYTDLSVAVSAVPDGALLLVRSGEYGPVQLLGKSLTITFDVGAYFRQSGSVSVAIEGLGSGQSVFLRGLQFAPNLGSMVIRNNLGFVDIESTGLARSAVAVQYCDRVRLKGFTFFDGVQVTSSNILFERCSIEGRGLASGPGLTQNGGAVDLVETSVTGGVGLTNFTAGPAVLMNGGNLRALGGGQLRCGLASINNGSQPPHAISGNGTVRVDPDVNLPANQTIAAGIALTYVRQPRVRVDAAIAPVAFSAHLTGPNGAVGVLAIGLPGASHGAIGVLDRLWWDGSTAVVQAVGPTSQLIPLSATLNVPNSIHLAGVRLIWHGLVYEPLGGLQLSPAASGLVP